MSTSKTLWYRIGYALEKTRRSPVQKRLASLAERQDDDEESGGSPFSDLARMLVGGSTPSRTSDASTSASDGEDEEEGGFDAGDLWPLLGTVGMAALTRLVSRRPLTMGAIVKAALVGAGAETARLMVRRLRFGPAADEELTDDLMRGAANGLVYGSILAPIAPGAALSKGLIYGAGSYLASAKGGVPELLGTLSPHRRIPGLSGLVRPAVSQEDVVDHLIFGIVLAVLYESNRASSGTLSTD